MSYPVPNIHVTMSARSELGPATEGACFPPGRRVHAVIHLSFDITVSPTTRSFLSSSQSLPPCSRLQARTRTVGRSRLYTVHFPPTRRRRNPCHCLPNPCLPTAVSMSSRLFSVLLLQSALALLVQGTIYVRRQARKVSYEHALTAMQPHGLFMTDYEAPPRLDVQWRPVVHGGMARRRRRPASLRHRCLPCRAI